MVTLRPRATSGLIASLGPMATSGPVAPFRPLDDVIGANGSIDGHISQTLKILSGGPK